MPRIDTPVIAIRHATHARSSLRAWPIAIAIATALAVGLGLVAAHGTAPRRSIAATAPKSLEAAMPPSIVIGTAREAPASHEHAPAHAPKTPTHPKPVATTPGF